MDIFPLIHIKRRRLLESLASDLASYRAMLEPYKDTVVYLLDLDGIGKNRPNLDLYQLLAGTYTLWVDAGPRKLGDVVDILMGGASRLTIRPDLWDIIDLTPIRDLTESPLYISVTATDPAYSKWDVPLEQADGVVTFLTKAEHDLDFKEQSYFKELCKKQQLYAYEAQTKHSTYWKYLGATGLLVDINKVEEFKRYGV
jgi:hypothetical protein